MDTTLLREFVTLVEHLNFSTASKLMNMSQSTLSRHIDKLERHFDVKLFVRGDTLKLTYAGQILLDELSDLFAIEQRIEERLREAKWQYSGSVLVEDYEFSHEVRNFLLRAINAFRATEPTVMFEFRRVKHNMTILDSVKSGYFNVGVLVKSGRIGAPIPSYEGFVTLPLRSAASRLAIYAHKETLKHISDVPSLSEFRDIPFLMPLKPEYASFQNDLRELCETCGFTPNLMFCEMHSYEQLAVCDMHDCVQIVRRGDVEDASSPFLMNPECRVVELAEEFYATPYLVFKQPAPSASVAQFQNYLETLAAGSATNPAAHSQC